MLTENMKEEHNKMLTKNIKEDNSMWIKNLTGSKLQNVN